MIAASTIREGQEVDPETGLIRPYTVQEMKDDDADLLIGNSDVKIEPLNRHESRVTSQVGLNEPDLNTVAVQKRMLDRIDLPTVLDSLGVVWNEVDGSSTSVAETGGAISGDGSLSIAASTSARGLEAKVPSLLPNRTFPNDENIDVIVCSFYMEGDSIAKLSEAQVRSRLTSVLGVNVERWPDFRPKPLVFILKGVRAEVKVTAQSQASLLISGGSLDSHSWSQSGAKGIDLVPSTQVFELPETIHKAGAFQTGQRSKSIDLTATAIAPSLFGLSMVNPTFSGNVTGTAEVEPWVWEGSGGDESIPTSGYKLYRYTTRPMGNGYRIVTGLVINFAALHG